MNLDEAKGEEDDLTQILERLNLSAVNNRVFSISDDTQSILRKFNLVLKDLINGVPTAYHDLESLLTNEDGQLQKSFNHLPGFLQKLIEQLPDKVTEKFAPEFLTMAAEKAGKSGISLEEATKTAEKAKKMGLRIPSLKELVGKPAAIAGMSRSIVSFLQARFPALMGMNVLMSLALFSKDGLIYILIASTSSPPFPYLLPFVSSISYLYWLLIVLLFVLWYCHKRGREVRLEKEKSKTEDATIIDENDNSNNTNSGSDDSASKAQTTTVAATGETGQGQDRAGVRETQDNAQQAAFLQPTAATATATATTTTSSTINNASSSPASTAENQTRRLKVVEPYSGT